LNKDLLDYIRTNKTVYTRQAINRRLRAAGHTDVEIESAWQQVLSEDTLPRQQAVVPSGARRAWPDRVRALIGLTLLAAAVVFGVLVFGGVGLFLSVVGSCPFDPSGLSN
jgi:hypothetical protein